MSTTRHGGILVVGDIHGDFGALNTLVNKRSPALILQCGDFGFWPKKWAQTLIHKGRVTLPKIKNPTKLFWCDGNHEDHWALKQPRCDEVYPNCFYMRRGATLSLPDGREVLFMGGARSTDKHFRQPGVDWFPDEEISPDDLRELPDTKIDIVISHTCPREFPILGNDMWSDDPSRMALSHVLFKYRPSLWYFGHFHYFVSGRYRDCRWTALSMAGFSHWWVQLPPADAQVAIGYAPHEDRAVLRCPRPAARKICG